MPKYKKPPIREAIIELRFNNRLSDEQLKTIKSELVKVYGIVDEIMGAKFELKVEHKKINSYQKSQLERLEFNLEPNLKARISKESVSWHRLAPYDSWEEFSEPMLRLWRIAEDFHDLQKLSRIGVRMVNDIGIPFGDSSAIDLEDFFTVLTRVPDDFPARPIGFTSHIQSAHDQEKAQSSISVASHRVEATAVHILLNIDVFRIYQDGYEGTFAELQPVLETLRELKNKLFESCITDATRELFK
ncbi:TIGR04255 family protein [Pseudidiomarina homiensis]|uniref:TIGR04255 family protein n=1 Tax=Pseudidiomarina homiensis TaxID=364198 RepID=UPI00215B459C|nr:TIGR04255 family protein [Pseudidiomarina homiensis]